MDSPPADALIRSLTAVFAAGLPQDDTVAHFIASTLGTVSPRELARLLADRDDPQAASLFELLLFPDRRIALALEPLLLAARLGPDAIDSLIDTLAATVSQGAALLPDGTRLPLPLARGDIERFIRRLAPQRNMPEAAMTTAEKRFGREAAMDLAVTARQTLPEWTPGATAFFTSLLGRLDPLSPKSLPAARYGLAFLAGLPAEKHPLPALSARWSQLAAQLRRARQQEDALAKSNFETLIMTGARLPYLHAPDIEAEQALAETALVALTGRRPQENAGVCHDLGTVLDVEGFLAVFGPPPET